MKEMPMNTDPFKEYLIEKDPTQKEKSYAWDTAIGLQAVDGLSPSGYLKETAAKNIKGEIGWRLCHLWKRHRIRSNTGL